MITLIRHSEKLKNVNKKKWERSKRFKENIHDTPITSNGKKIAKKAFNKLILQGYDNIDYLYCSPLTRCIQTCLVIKKIIKKKFKKELKIRIEYGLVESNFDSPIKFSNNDKNKCFFDKKSKIKYLDNELSLKNIIKKYGNDIDKSYKSKTKFKDVSFDKNNVYFINRCIKTFNDILKDFNKKDNVLIVTHGNFIFSIYTFLKNNYDSSKFEEVSGEYCSMLITDYKKKKIELLNNLN